MPNFEFRLYSSTWAHVWPSEYLKLIRYFESCLQTTAISDTCYEEGLRSKPSVSMQGCSPWLMGPGAIARPCELWGSFGLLLSEESVSDFVGLFPYGYQAGGFQHVPPTTIDA